MSRASVKPAPRRSCDIVDFDAALLQACAPAVRADLLVEARLLAAAFAPDGAAPDLETMATQLSAGARDGELPRPHARRLAAALKHLANGR